MYSSVHSIPVSNDMFLSSSAATAGTGNPNDSASFSSLFHHNSDYTTFDNLANHYEDLYSSHPLISDRPNSKSRASHRSSSLSSHSNLQCEKPEDKQKSSMWNHLITEDLPLQQHNEPEIAPLQSVSPTASGSIQMPAVLEQHQFPSPSSSIFNISMNGMPSLIDNQVLQQNIPYPFPPPSIGAPSLAAFSSNIAPNHPVSSPVSAPMFMNPCETSSCLYNSRIGTSSLRSNGSQHTSSFFGHRFMPLSCLADESLPTYPNAAAAPNRLPAHKPVRLAQPKHPLAPPNIPVYFKYGEEHYPEETVPPEYTFTETDGTICRYITNFLVYNKRGERLLPIEVLDQPRHAALVLYGSLLPAAAMSRCFNSNPPNGNNNCNNGGNYSEYGNMRGRKRLNSIINSNQNDDYMGNCLNNSNSNSSFMSFNRKDDSVAHWKNLQCYPVRVELAEWCIDYGQEPTNVPFIWLISRWDVYYRLEKPAGRYSSTFASAKMKFEVSTRIIKTLQHRPDIPFKTLVDLLTAATRHEKQKKKKKEFLKSCKKEKLNSGTMCNEDEVEKQLAENTIKKKQRSVLNKQYSLSTAQGTGIFIDDDSGKPQALTPWGAPYAVEKFKESLLLNLAEFLESQLRNFMEGVGSTSNDVLSVNGSRTNVCYNLLMTPFMRVLREKTAVRMEILQLIDTKRRALEVAKSLAEYPFSSNNGGTGSNSAIDLVSPYMFNQKNAGFGNNEYIYAPINIPTHENVNLLESELQQLQQMLLEDSDYEEDKVQTKNEDSDENQKCQTDSNSSAVADDEVEDPQQSSSFNYHRLRQNTTSTAATFPSNGAQKSNEPFFPSSYSYSSLMLNNPQTSLNPINDTNNIALHPSTQKLHFLSTDASNIIQNSSPSQKRSKSCKLESETNPSNSQFMGYLNHKCIIESNFPSTSSIIIPSSPSTLSSNLNWNMYQTSSENDNNGFANQENCYYSKNNEYQK